MKKESGCGVGWQFPMLPQDQWGLPRAQPRRQGFSHWGGVFLINHIVHFITNLKALYLKELTFYIGFASKTPQSRNIG